MDVTEKNYVFLFKKNQWIDEQKLYQLPKPKLNVMLDEVFRMI